MRTGAGWIADWGLGTSLRRDACPAACRPCAGWTAGGRNAQNEPNSRRCRVGRGLGDVGRGPGGVVQTNPICRAGRSGAWDSPPPLDPPASPLYLADCAKQSQLAPVPAKIKVLAASRRKKSGGDAQPTKSRGAIVRNKANLPAGPGGTRPQGRRMEAHRAKQTQSPADEIPYDSTILSIHHSNPMPIVQNEANFGKSLKSEVSSVTRGAGSWQLLLAALGRPIMSPVREG
jgi:hypothetical protein